MSRVDEAPKEGRDDDGDRQGEFRQRLAQRACQQSNFVAGEARPQVKDEGHNKVDLDQRPCNASQILEVGIPWITSSNHEKCHSEQIYVGEKFCGQTLEAVIYLIYSYKLFVFCKDIRPMLLQQRGAHSKERVCCRESVYPSRLLCDSSMN